MSEAQVQVPPVG